MLAFFTNWMIMKANMSLLWGHSRQYCDVQKFYICTFNPMLDFEI